MLREEMIKRLEELPDQILEAEEVYNLDLVTKIIQIEWHSSIAYFLTEYRTEADCVFVYFKYKGWRITMELPTQGTLNKETQPCL